MTEQDFSITVSRGTPTDEELAAVIAVLTETYRAEVATAESIEKKRPSTWVRTRNKMRGDMRRHLDWNTWSK